MHSNACMHANACICITKHLDTDAFKKWTTEHHQTTFPIENDTPQGASVVKCFVMHMHALACIHALECIVVNVLLY